MNYESSWPMIQRAAAGANDARHVFTRRYLPVMRAYLAARWRNSPLWSEVDDAVQDAFVECFRQNGALQNVMMGPGDDFRGFLLGVVRNVARRFEAAIARRREKQARSSVVFHDIPAREARLSQVFDRAWASNVMRQAADLQAINARGSGGNAERRVELLRLRFHEALPIREIARLWDEAPARVHHEYATARKEFHACLRQIVAQHLDIDWRAPQHHNLLETECERLLDLLE